MSDHDSPKGPFPLITEENKFNAELARILEYHAMEIGRVAISWNVLHEELGQQFAATVSPKAQDVALAAWHAVRSDRNARDMLAAATKKLFGPESKFAHLLIKGVLNQMNSIEDARNSILHAPYGFDFNEQFEVFFVPSSEHGNPHARKLAEKGFVDEIQFTEWKINELRRFLHAIQHQLGHPEDARSWPDIPALRRAEFDNQQDRYSSQRQQQPPPESSQE
ncbi:hypothetical protein [Nisaea sp.]|uniref:hypothetical protein n=1 Tax=Nisaea sp. TaxID=2024842 RepID=UPI003B520E1E